MCVAFRTKRRRTGGSKTPVGSENGAVRWNGVFNKYRILCKNDAQERDDVRHNAATQRTQASAQRGVDLLEHPCARAEVLLAELVERRRVGVEVRVEVFGVGRQVQKAGADLALDGGLGDLVLGADAVGGIVAGAQLAQLDDAAVVLRDFDDAAFGVVDRDRFASRPEVEAVDGLVVVADVVVALGGARVVIEGDAGADDVDEGGALVRDGGLDERGELLLVAAEAARDEGGAHEERERDGVDRRVGVDGAALGLAALVGGGGELALGEAVDAVVLQDVGHVDAAAHDVRELAEADRGGVAVARDAEVDQVAVGEVRAGERRGHAAVDGVEAVRVAEEVVGGLRAAADAGELGDLVRLDVELPERLDQRRRDRVVAAAGAQRADFSLVVAARIADLVLGEGRMVELRLEDVGHAALSLWIGRTLSAVTICEISAVMKRAVIGVPS